MSCSDNELNDYMLAIGKNSVRNDEIVIGKLQVELSEKFSDYAFISDESLGPGSPSNDASL